MLVFLSAFILLLLILIVVYFWIFNRHLFIRLFSGFQSSNGGYSDINSIISLDIQTRYPSFSKRDIDAFMKDGKIVQSRLPRQGRVIYHFNVYQGGYSIQFGPYICMNKKYYTLTKKIIDTFYLPITSIEKAKEYIDILYLAGELPDATLRSKQGGYIRITNKQDYTHPFIEEWSHCLPDRPIGVINLKDNVYNIEEIYFNYEKKAFLCSIQYELRRDGFIRLCNERVIYDCGIGILEGKEYIR